MPGMPIFQDSPSQLKGQIYVLKGTAVSPLEVDSTGKLGIAGTVGLESGATVGLASGATVGLSSGTTVGLSSGTTVGLSSGTTVGLSSGTTVGLSAGTNVIGTVRNELVFTNTDSFGDETVLTAKTVGATATVNSDSEDISKESSYNWFIKNNGTLATQNITLKVYISPDDTNWVEDTGTTITVAFGASKMITVTNFLKYARFVITGGEAETTVISCFQAQH